MDAIHLTGVALAALLSENFLLVSCLGIGTRVEAFRSYSEAKRTGLSLLLAMVCTVPACWLADLFLLRQMGLEHLRLMVFTLISLGIVALLRVFFKTFLPELSARLDASLAALSTNCAALGAALLASLRGYELDQAMIFALCGGLGVLVVLISFAGLRQEVGFDDCPKAFQGAPIELITAGLMALALVGYYGLHIG